MSIRNRILVTVMFVFLPVSYTLAKSVIGYWDFSTGIGQWAPPGLEATIGEDLEGWGGYNAWVSTAGRASLNPATPTEGMIMSTGGVANGGGSKLNQYTLIMDLIFNSANTMENNWSLYQTDMENLDDAEVFVHAHGYGPYPPDDAIGTLGQWIGYLGANVAHRLALAVDLTDLRDDGQGHTVPAIDVYIDGAYQGALYLYDPNGLRDTGVDGDWALGEDVLLFADNDGETAKFSTYAIQIRDYRMTAYGVESVIGAFDSEGISCDFMYDPPPPLQGDITGDGKVDANDLAVLAMDWLYSVY